MIIYDMKGFQDRFMILIEELIKRTGKRYNIKRIAEECEIPYVTLHSAIKRGNIPNIGIVTTIAKKYNINLNWFLRDQKPVFLDEIEKPKYKESEKSVLAIMENPGEYNKIKNKDLLNALETAIKLSETKQKSLAKMIEAHILLLTEHQNNDNM